jgi:hypothetical protein
VEPNRHHLPIPADDPELALTHDVKITCHGGEMLAMLPASCRAPLRETPSKQSRCSASAGTGDAQIGTTSTNPSNSPPAATIKIKCRRQESIKSKKR